MASPSYLLSTKIHYLREVGLREKLAEEVEDWIREHLVDEELYGLALLALGHREILFDLGLGPGMLECSYLICHLYYSLSSRG